MMAALSSWDWEFIFHVRVTLTRVQGKFYW